MKRVWITGYRSYELSIFNDKDPKLIIIKEALKHKIIEKIEDGAEWFLAGPQLGTEQWGLMVCNDLKSEYPKIKTALMMPFANFGQQWNENNTIKLSNLKQKVDFCDSIIKQDYQSPQQLRNFQTFMLNHTDEALMLYDPEKEGKSHYDYQAIQRFQAHHEYNLDLIDFYDLQEEAELYNEKQASEHDF